MKKNITAKVVVIGSGPGGYAAAFRAADLLGEGVVLIERYSVLGGVCLNVGCIPSKALLHLAAVLDETKTLAAHGVSFGTPQIDFDKMRGFKSGVVKKLNKGLAQLAKRRKVEVVTGTAQFVSDRQINVISETVECTIDFEHCVIAVGSQPMKLPFLPEDPRIFTSTGALELPAQKGRLLIIGGGIIGMEMATVYHALGLQITIVELSPALLAGMDNDIVQSFTKRMAARYEAILLNTKVVKVEAQKKGIMVTFEGEHAPEPQCYDFVLSAVGRVPNGKLLGAEHAGVTVEARGFIPVDNQLRTNVPHIFAIGDVIGNPMLAHKATAEGRLAAEIISGKNYVFEPKCIPSVAYTDPEVAWVGLLEKDAKAQNIEYGKGIFPWAASGRAIGIGREEGLTKVIFDKHTHRVLGAAIMGPHAGDLINEVALAIEMGCEAEDLALTIHAHPTLSETIPLAAEVYEGTVTDL